MKKITAILLLAIFAFNMVGYHLVSSYFSNQSDNELEKALNTNQYEDNQLVLIKLPVNLPYYTNNKTFARIDGEVDLKGITCKYVKYRIYNDSLEMLCIPNLQKMKIEISKNDYAKVIHDFQQENTKKKSGSDGKSFQKKTDFLETKQFYETTHFQLPLKKYTSVTTALYSKNYFKIVEQPPDVA